MVAERVNRRVNAACRRRRNIRRGAACGKIDLFERCVVQDLADCLLVVVREFQHLRGDVELAVDLAHEAVPADGREAGERLLHVAGAERLVHLAARAKDGIERMGAKRSVFPFEGLLEGGHRGVVGGLALG